MIVHESSVTSREQMEERRPARRRFLPPILYTVRFGITAWHAGILILTLALLGLGLRAALVQSLNSDAEKRLMNAATEVQRQIDRTSDASGRNASFTLNGQQMNVKSLDLAGISVSVVDASTGRAVFSHGPLASLWPDSNSLKTILSERSATYSISREDQYSIRGLSLPLTSQNVNGQHLNSPVIVGMIFTSESMETTNAILKKLTQYLVIAGVAGGLIATLGGWTLAGRALAPVNRIMKSADDLAHDQSVGALSRRVPVPHTGDEISALGDTFNRMLDRIERSFTTQRRFVADASHELRTPLTSIKGNVDVLRRQLNSGRPMEYEDIADALGDVSRETARMSRLIDDLLALARSESEAHTNVSQRRLIDLDDLARDVLRMAEGLSEGQTLVLDAPDHVHVYGDMDKLTQVFLIMLDNALRHTPSDGSVTVSVHSAHDEQDNIECARVEIRDTGVGIEAQHLPHLFERFYRAEGSRSRASGGTGLGLSIALSIVRSHDGWIDVESQPGHGTRFIIWLPNGTVGRSAVPEPPAIAAQSSR